MKYRYLKIITVSTLGMLCLVNSSCKEEKKTVKPLIINFTKEGELTLKKTSTDSIIKSIDIEIADDEYQTQTGLMYRDSMEDNQGMLFVFPKAAFHSFYMKNTKIALDIIYIDADKKIINIQKNAKPFSENSLPSSAPAQYVLEINAGLSDQWQLEVGDHIEYSYH